MWLDRYIFRVTDDLVIIEGTILNLIDKLQVDKDIIKLWYETVYAHRGDIIECTLPYSCIHFVLSRKILRMWEYVTTCFHLQLDVEVDKEV